MTYLAVFLSALASMIIGGIWYSPKFFANYWIAEIRMTPEEMEQKKKQKMAKTYALAFIWELITAFVMLSIFQMLGIIGILGALQIALMLWIGFSLSVVSGEVLWANTSKRLFLIHAGYQGLRLLAMASVLAFFL